MLNMKVVSWTLGSWGARLNHARSQSWHTRAGFVAKFLNSHSSRGGPRAAARCFAPATNKTGASAYENDCDDNFACGRAAGRGAVAFIYSGIYDVGASTRHGAVSSWVMETTMRSSIERRASQIEVPDLGDESLVLAGVNDFEEMCVQCHGAPGKKPAAVGQGLNPPAPDLAESANEMTAAELFWVTKHGVKMTGMPAWGSTHEDDALWPVVALMTALRELDAVAYEGLLNRAEGMGHHANDEAENDHAHGADNENEAPHDDGESADEKSDETEHDHNTHEH